MNLSHSLKDIKYHFFMHYKKETENLYFKFSAFLSMEEPAKFTELEVSLNTVQKKNTTVVTVFYTKVKLTIVENIDITTIINVNRELFLSN